MTDQASIAVKRMNPPELTVPPGYSQAVEVRCGRIIFIAGLIVAGSIAAKKPLEGNRVGTLREGLCVFPTLEERKPAPVG
jgi:hypothetical protein